MFYARSHKHRLSQCYCFVGILSFIHSAIPSKETACRCNLRPENIYVSETKYQKYQQNIKGNSSFRMWKCENFLSSLARILIDFSQCSYFVIILSIQRHAISNKRELHWLYVQMYFEIWKCMFLRRSLASLARAYKLQYFL